MRGIIICFCLLLLSACGGSGSSNKNSPESIKSTSSSISSLSLSSPVSQSSSSVVPPPTRLIMEEDAILEIRPEGITDQVSAYLIDALTVSSGKRIPMETESHNGGRVVISNDSRIITYMPRKNFSGNDEFYYWVQGLWTNTKVKINITVTPVADTQPDFSLNDNRFFVAGDLILLEFLLDVDTQQYFSPDSSTRIYINSTPVEYKVNSSNLTLVVPPVVRAGMQSLIYEQEIHGHQIRIEKHLLVKIDSDDVTYYQGNKESPGQAVVLVWTEGTEGFNPEIWMNKELGAFLKIPLHLRYSKYFNISAIKPIAKRKLYAGTMTADFDFYSEFVSKYSQSNMQMVIMISELGGGNAGSHVTMGPDGGVKVLLHELGHLHARLGDEYTAPLLGSEYDEGSYPNITYFFNRDVARLPWKHWLIDENQIPGIHIDPVSDIETGVFMGAHYTKNGLYRSTKNSVMNSGEHLGDVNSEAWALANYQYLGLLSSATNEKVNNQRVINIVRAWDKNITRIDWYVDDVKQEQFTNLAQLVVDEDKISGSSYSIRSELVDLTGYIRNPYANLYDETDAATNSTLRKTWNIKKTNTETTSQKIRKSIYGNTSNLGNGWTVHTMSIADGKHQLDSTYMDSQHDSLMPVTTVSDLLVDIVVAGEVVYRLGVDLQQFDRKPVAIPLQQLFLQGYRIAHPKISGNYLLRIYNFPQRELVAEFAF